MNNDIPEYLTYPKWLKNFRFTIHDEYETGLFDPYKEYTPDVFRFEDDLGAVVGSTVLIHKIKYEVVRFEIYSDLNVYNLDKTTDFCIQLNLVVRKL